MTYTWKILELTAENDQIKNARYKVIATDGENTVETENYHTFTDTTFNIPYAEIYEHLIITAIQDETTIDGVSSIKSRLDEQLNNLKSNKTVGLPWLANTFTPEL
ncbi:hypothetical protein UFOVP96_7 [uncultured Caudovirales phage]|uniref:DUF7936 domain-containing protein n=1 Tax=uncultured Caudovirales phage TaxID=2100421 RepID=A0A6J5L5E3_9CAUD|nr:hypothetical protein UFOVP96_7 [uncultured Caudovirales phage]